MSIQIKKLYNDIGEFDYTKSIERFVQDNNLNIKYKSNSDMIINYYIKTQSDLSIIILYPKALEHNKLNLLYDNLKNNGYIHYEKNIKLDYKMMYNIIFQLYIDENKLNSHTKIINKLKYIGFIYNNFSNIKIIVYKHYNNKLDIKGSGSPYKTLLRKIFTNNDEELYDYLHISSDDNQVYQYSNIFFNKNTFRMLRKQKCWQLLCFNKSLNIFRTLKDFIYKYSLNESETLLLIGSSTLFTYGIRELNNINGILLYNNINHKELNNINNLNIIYEKSHELKKYCMLLGINNYKELVLNPKYYYYFLGIKILRLKYNIILKSNKYNSLQITDLLILKQYYNLKYKLIYKYIYIDDIQKYLKKYYFITISKNNIKNWLDNKIYINYKDLEILENSQSYISENNFKQVLNIKYNKNYTIDKDISNDKYIYPSKNDLIKMNYKTNIIIYNSYKPYLYPGEVYYPNKYCLSNYNIKNHNSNNLRIMTFNVHNFITRCNQGINPVFDHAINPFTKPRDIYRFIDFFKIINADVICLQEVVPILPKDIIKDITDYDFIRNNFNYHFLNKLMKQIGYEYKIISSTQKGYYNNNDKYYFLSNAIYSKIILEEPTIYQMNFLDRNFISCQITFNNKQYNIINCHMEYKYLPKYNFDPILLQFNILENIIKDKFKYNNVILTGDLNINIYKFSKQYKNWNEKVNFIHSNFINTDNKSIITNFHQNNTTDYILLSKKSSINLIYNKTIQTYLSDHYPIISDFN